VNVAVTPFLLNALIIWSCSNSLCKQWYYLLFFVHFLSLGRILACIMAGKRRGRRRRETGGGTLKAFIAWEEDSSISRASHQNVLSSKDVISIYQRCQIRIHRPYINSCFNNEWSEYGDRIRRYDGILREIVQQWSKSGKTYIILHG